MEGQDGKNANEDMVLEDNYIDMNAGEKRVRIISGEPVGLKVRSVYDILRKNKGFGALKECPKAFILYRKL